MSTPKIMQYFDHRHLADGPLRDISREYTEFAHKINNYLPDSAEKSTALRKLLESKDSAVRSALDLAQPHERAEQHEDVSGIHEGGEELPLPNPATLARVLEGEKRKQNHPGDVEMDRPRGGEIKASDQIIDPSSIPVEDSAYENIHASMEAMLARQQARRAHGY